MLVFFSESEGLLAINVEKILIIVYDDDAFVVERVYGMYESSVLCL